jgi:copper homeostasis protein
VNPQNRPILEVCVQSPTDCSLAAEGGADRVELCQAIELGGLTPSAGAITATCRVSSLPVIVLTRPRPGDFIYSPAEIDCVTRDLEQLKVLGARGAAFGALTTSGDIDRDALETWIAASQGLELVFHRAFDSCRAPLESLELLAELGVHRVLSSGGAATAVEGAEQLATWIEATRGRLEILPGGSIRASHAAELLAKTGAEGVHFRAPSTQGRESTAHPLGSSDTGLYEVTDPAIVRAIRHAVS